MLFRQSYYIREHGQGRQTIQFAVSDIYDSLFDSEAPYTEVDIFQLATVKQDLNTDDGKFAIDELEFTVNQAMCKTTEQLNALFFCLDATAVNVNRYVACWFADSLDVSELVFVGQINSNISASDLVWHSSEYKVNHKPLREYKFKCLSFDVSILEQATLLQKPRDLFNEEIDSIMDRFLTLDNESWIKSNCTYKPMYREWNLASGPTLGKYVHLRPTISLFEYLKKILSFTNDLLEEKINSILEFDLVDSDVGFGILPAYITGRNTNAYNQYMLTFKPNQYQAKTDRPIKLRICSNESLESDESNIYVNSQMIHSQLYDTNYWIESGKMVIDGLGEDSVLIPGESELTFLKSDNVAKLLFDIARALGCFVTFQYNTSNSIGIKFVSRQSIIKDELVYLAAPESAQIDISSNANNGSDRYYTTAGAFFESGTDILIPRVNFDGLLGYTKVTKETKKFKLFKENREREEQQNKVEFTRLLFSLGTPLEKLENADDFANDVYPFNTVIANSVQEQFEKTGFLHFNRTQGSMPAKVWGHICNAIYVRTSNLQGTTTPAQDITSVISPAMGIIVNINGVDKYYNRLEEYINDIMLVSEQYYKAEYDITIPFWNLFGTDENGANKSWKNIRVGSKIRFTESVRRYISSSFSDFDVTRDYVVVGLERDLSKPGTKLKLVNAEAFAFGYANTINPTEQLIFSNQLGLDDNLITSSAPFEGYEIAEFEVIHLGDAVMVGVDGKVFKAVNKKEHYHKPIGIALNDGEGGDTVKVQFTGRVYGLHNFTSAGKTIYIRANPSGSNISENCLAGPTADENVIIELGQTDTTNSFIIDIYKLCYKELVEL
ncbi:hypothetical protein MASR1M45_05930 [Candidatus Kapaibacterium sp.]